MILILAAALCYLLLVLEPIVAKLRKREAPLTWPEQLRLLVALAGIVLFVLGCFGIVHLPAYLQ
jgi:hypothetical protein